MKPKLRFKGYDEEWKNHSLSEACSDFKYGLNAAATEFNGKEKYLRITDIDDSSRIFSKENLTSPDVKNLTNEYQLSENDIVFARTGASVGKTYLYDSKDGEVYWAGFLIRGKVNEKFDSNFVFQNTLTKNYNKFILITSQRSGQPGVNANEYGEFSFRAPSKVEQREIGEYFRKLDGLIKETGKEIEKLDNVKQASLQKMFPQPGESVPQIRFKGFNEPWEEKRLGEIGSTFNGLSGKTKEDFGHGDARFVTYMNVFSNPLTSISEIDKIELDNKQFAVQKGDVFFTTSSETPEEVGMSSVWKYDIPNVYLNSFCFGFRPNIELNLDYISRFLRSPFFRSQIILLAQGISRFNISKTKAMELTVLLPSLEEQKAIGDYFLNLEKMISSKKKKLEKLKQIKASCLNLMFV